MEIENQYKQENNDVELNMNDQEMKLLNELWDYFYEINNNFPISKDRTIKDVCEYVFEWIGRMRMEAYADNDGKINK